MRIVALDVHQRTRTLNTPFASVKRGVLREVVTTLVELRLEDGRSAWGEIAMPAVSGETPGGVLAALRGPLRDAVIGAAAEDLEQLTERIERALTGNQGAKSAVDIAVHDAFAQVLAAPLYRVLGGSARELETCVTLGTGPAEEVARRAAELVAGGCTAVKMKVGGETAEDLSRVLAVRRAVGAGVKLLLDANQSWTAKKAVHILRSLEDAGADIELVEQPVAAWDRTGMRYVRERATALIVADESLVSAQDALDIVRHEAADVLALKLQKNGGISKVLRIAAVAEAAGLPCMIGCSLESEVSISAAAAVAAARSCFTYVDLDAPLLLDSSPVHGGVQYHGTAIRLPEAAGLGVTGLRAD